MIYLITLILYLITMFLSVKTIKNKNITENEEIGLGVLITTFTFVISLLTYQIIDSIDEANKIKAKIILMKPLDLYKKDIAIAEKELMKVERYIERAFDKNNPNISVDLKDGVKFYSILGNSDFGSAEMGNAKKQELLLNYIDKQNELAEKLIFIRKMAYGGDEYYQLQQEYAVYANSIFSGLFVRWFSMKENYSGVVNNVIYAK